MPGWVHNDLRSRARILSAPSRRWGMVRASPPSSSAGCQRTHPSSAAETLVTALRLGGASLVAILEPQLPKRKALAWVWVTPSSARRRGSRPYLRCASNYAPRCLCWIALRRHTKQAPPRARQRIIRERNLACIFLYGARVVGGQCDQTFSVLGPDDCSNPAAPWSKTAPSFANPGDGLHRNASDKTVETTPLKRTRWRGPGYRARRRDIAANAHARFAYCGSTRASRSLRATRRELAEPIFSTGPSPADLVAIPGSWENGNPGPRPSWHTDPVRVDALLQGCLHPPAALRQRRATWR